MIVCQTPPSLDLLYGNVVRKEEGRLCSQQTYALSNLERFVAL